MKRHKRIVIELWLEEKAYVEEDRGIRNITLLCKLGEEIARIQRFPWIFRVYFLVTQMSDGLRKRAINRPIKDG